MSAPDDTLRCPLLDAAARYAPQGRWVAGFARGKLLGDPVYAAVLPRLGPGGTLLDVGCGEGYLLALARTAHRDLKLIGLDHDPRRVGIARRLFEDDPRAELIVADALDGDLPPAEYVACLDVLHYEPPDRQDRLLARLAGALAGGGRLFVREAERGSGWRSRFTALSERVAVAAGRHRGRGVFLRPGAEIVAAMERCGLDVERLPCREGTPFANTLYVGTRADPRP